MTRTQPASEPPKGVDLRLRVRRITAGIVGAATLASAALTANLALANDDQTSATSPTTGSATGATTNSTSGAPSNSSSGTPRSTPPATALTAPQQAPSAGTGHGHARSGGS